MASRRPGRRGCREKANGGNLGRDYTGGADPVRISVYMRRILVTNDDGYFSPGIEALATALAPLGEVTIVAPQNEASAVGHALTLRRPLRLEQIRERVYCVDGTPTDCVNLAIDEVLDGPPDLIVSGINRGLNVGDDVTYSGTVAGALEGALLGYPAIAVSLQFTKGEWQFERAAAAAATLAGALLEKPLPPRTFLNVNVPLGVPKGVRVTVQAKRNHVTKIDRRARSPRPRLLLDRRGPGRLGAGRSIGPSGDPGRLRVGDAAPAGPDRSRRARDRRVAGAAAWRRTHLAAAPRSWANSESRE